MVGDLGEKRLGCIHGCLPSTFPLTCWEAVHKCKNLLSACHIAECHSNVSDFSVFVLSAAEISMARPLQRWSAPGISWQLVFLVFGANSAHFCVDPAHCSGQKKPSLDIAFGLDTWKPQVLLFWAQKLILFAQECLCAREAGAAWGRMSSCDVLWWKSDTQLKKKGPILSQPSLVGETPIKSVMFGPESEHVGISINWSIQTVTDDLWEFLMPLLPLPPAVRTPSTPFSHRRAGISLLFPKRYIWGRHLTEQALSADGNGFRYWRVSLNINMLAPAPLENQTPPLGSFSRHGFPSWKVCVGWIQHQLGKIQHQLMGDLVSPQCDMDRVFLL